MGVSYLSFSNIKSIQSVGASGVARVVPLGTTLKPSCGFTNRGVAGGAQRRASRLSDLFSVTYSDTAKAEAIRPLFSASYPGSGD